MVRVFKCHSFASQKVIQVDKEPLTICADKNRVFVATNDCEIVVFQISDGSPKEIHRFPTVSLVEQAIVNSCKNCIITTELKKSWKGMTKSVRVYLNWEHSGMQGASKQRARVRVAGKSHIQHTSGASMSKQVEIVEVPVDGNASCIAVCNYTGNFAIASGCEVKLCSLVEKTIPNSDRTYMDVEVFLELCWSFSVKSISLCEEYIVCCSAKEVQGIRVRYDEGDRESLREARKLVKSPSGSYQSNQDGGRVSSNAVSPRSFASEIMMYPSTTEGLGDLIKNDDQHFQLQSTDISSVGMRSGGRQTPKPGGLSSPFTKTETRIVEDEHFVEWNFTHRANALSSSQGEGHAVCLPGLHTTSSQAQCHRHVVSPPVLSDFSGGKVKSSSGVQAETVLHLSDPRGQEDWMNVTLIPSQSTDLPAPLSVSGVPSTDRMRSHRAMPRSSMCCYISGTRGGCLYQLGPHLGQISLYKYTDHACQVGVSSSFLHVVTRTGIETYTSRWGVVCLEMRDREMGTVDLARPPSNLDICLVGHEPFFGASCLSVGDDFLALLSKVEEDSRDKEAHWGLYVLHSFNLVDQYNDMLTFATRIQHTGPASYIHLLQEAHLLLSPHPRYLHMGDPDVVEALRQVSRLIADYCAQPGQNEWQLAWPYYNSSASSVQQVVGSALFNTGKKNPQEFGKGLIDFLDHELLGQDEFIDLDAETCNAILDIYAVAAPKRLSKVILLSSLKKYSPETALRHLKTWLAVKASSEQAASPLDRLAVVHLNLQLCEVEVARDELRTIPPPALVDVCATHPTLLHEGLNTFTPLAQLMRQHLAGTLLDALVELLDRGAMSLDSLLILLKNQSQTNLPHNTHMREVLELILSNKKRAFLYDEAVNLLCQVYIARVKDRAQLMHKQISAMNHQKFSLPHGDGHFAPRYAWLDQLPPFLGAEQMTRPCQRLEVKHVAGGMSKVRGSSLPVAVMSKNQDSTQREMCPCCRCNEGLLKLQSLLCSSFTTQELAESVLKFIGQGQGEGQVKGQKVNPEGSLQSSYNSFTEEGGHGKVENESMDTNIEESSNECLEERGECCEVGDYWDSVQLLCLVKTDISKAIDVVVTKYPLVAGSFGVCCFEGDIEKFTQLLRCMEAALKSSSSHQGKSVYACEETYVKAYKGLLWRLTHLLPTDKLVEILPADANLFFLLPFLTASLEQSHRDKLRGDIVDMGQQLLKS